MQQIVRPATERELQQLLSDASRNRTPVEIMGAGSKRAVGRPTQAAVTLSMGSMSGISLYEPTELVLSARAGTPLARVEAELARQGQMLAFEPVDLGPVLGVEPGHATIGGVLATNISGARRIASGGARDHALGLVAVSGAGQPFRAGGRVMKNVTGYDLTRGLSGSWGTLAVLTEVTFKVMPLPEETASLVMFGLADEIAIEVLCTAMGTPYEVSGAVHLQQPLSARLWHASTRAQHKAVTALRLENFSRSVAYRLQRLKEELKPYGEIHELDHRSSLAFWDELRQLSILQDSDAPLWRISTAPKSGPKVVAAITRYMECQAFYDWSGGLIWAEVLPTADAGAADIRRVMATHGGHATLIRAAPAVRAAVEVFQPLEQRVAEISRGLKSVFDPAGILNPGRMYAEA
ncbi:MAG: glycolate oxidase subunit GlcE [Bacteroidota bacterium]